MDCFHVWPSQVVASHSESQSSVTRCHVLTTSSVEIWQLRKERWLCSRRRAIRAVVAQIGALRVERARRCSHLCSRESASSYLCPPTLLSYFHRLDYGGHMDSCWCKAALFDEIRKYAATRFMTGRRDKQKCAQ